MTTYSGLSFEKVDSKTIVGHALSAELNAKSHELNVRNATWTYAPATMKGTTFVVSGTRVVKQGLRSTTGQPGTWTERWTLLRADAGFKGNADFSAA